MGTFFRNSIAVALSASALVACQSLKATKPTPAPATEKAEYGTYGLATDFFDRSVRPGDDFFRHAAGTWLKTTPIPDDRSYFGIDTLIADRAEGDLREIAEAAAGGTAAPGSNERKVGDFYASYMDVAAIEARGLAPVKPALDAIAAIKTPQDLARAFASANESFGAAPFGLYIDSDAKNPDAYAVYLVQAGLGMPDRDYYLKREKAYEDYRASYRAYVEQLLTLGGVAYARPRAESILALETRMARAHWPAEESRDAEKTYNPITIAGLSGEAPGFAWASFAKAAGIDGGAMIVASQKSAVPKLAKIVDYTDIEVWKAYLTFHTLDQAAPFLPKAFDDANFAFRGKTLGGRSVQRDRWKRAVRLLDAQIGEAFGQAYVAKRFPPSARALALDLVANAKRALSGMIAEAAWFDPATKTAARAKLDAMGAKIGYPDTWRDYSALAIARDDLFGNMVRALSFEYRRNIAKLGKPIDRGEWYMTPQTVNAYNDFGKNEIVFTAAILQPPYFDPRADAAVNYGEAGAVIGHEISHGFDDQGRKFDARGKLEEWWTPKDAAAYSVQANKLVAQFNAYEPLPGLHINGQLTLGENIADLAGLAIAYRAYRLSLGGIEAPVRDGLSGDQRFFLAYAQSWIGQRREAAQRQQILSDPHSPEEYRVNGIVRNFDPWYAAFNVQPGDRLYLKPEERVRLW
ncbi:MAG: M13 family metallopeptidase [Alphaproteobacteria bacterium]|nr:M13 family metallopeptidase [Alphaproteobacteria bacterium]